MAESESGSSLSGMQRERIVGSNFPGAWESTRNIALLGGSSSIFRIAFAALRLRSSAGSMMTMRQLPVPEVCEKNALPVAPRPP